MSEWASQTVRLKELQSDSVSARRSGYSQTVCLSVFICLSAWVCVCLSVCLSVWSLSVCPSVTHLLSLSANLHQSINISSRARNHFSLIHTCRCLCWVWPLNILEIFKCLINYFYSKIKADKRGWILPGKRSGMTCHLTHRTEASIYRPCLNWIRKVLFPFAEFNLRMIFVFLRWSVNRTSLRSGLSLWHVGRPPS